MHSKDPHKYATEFLLNRILLICICFCLQHVAEPRGVVRAGVLARRRHAHVRAVRGAARGEWNGGRSRRGGAAARPRLFRRVGGAQPLRCAREEQPGKEWSLCSE